MIIPSRHRTSVYVRRTYLTLTNVRRTLCATRVKSDGEIDSEDSRTSSCFLRAGSLSLPRSFVSSSKYLGETSSESCGQSLAGSVEATKGEDVQLVITLQEQNFDNSTILLWKRNDTLISEKHCFLEDGPILIKCGAETNITISNFVHLGNKKENVNRIQILELLITSSEYGDLGNLHS